MSFDLRLVLLVLGALVLPHSASAFPALTDGLNALRKGDYAAAAKELKPLAERGDAEAHYRVGLMYEFGKGFLVDKAEAIRWFRKSAAQSHPAAQLELGILHATGDGVPQDDAQVVVMFCPGGGADAHRRAPCGRSISTPITPVCRVPAFSAFSKHLQA